MKTKERNLCRCNFLLRVRGGRRSCSFVVLLKKNKEIHKKKKKRKAKHEDEEKKGKTWRRRRGTFVGVTSFFVLEAAGKAAVWVGGADDFRFCRSLFIFPSASSTWVAFVRASKRYSRGSVPWKANFSLFLLLGLVKSTSTFSSFSFSLSSFSNFFFFSFVDLVKSTSTFRSFIFSLSSLSSLSFFFPTTISSFILSHSAPISLKVASKLAIVAESFFSDLSGWHRRASALYAFFTLTS